MCTLSQHHAQGKTKGQIRKCDDRISIVFKYISSIWQTNKKFYIDCQSQHINVFKWFQISRYDCRLLRCHCMLQRCDCVLLRSVCGYRDVIVCYRDGIVGYRGVIVCYRRPDGVCRLPIVIVSHRGGVVVYCSGVIVSFHENIKIHRSSYKYSLRLPDYDCKLKSS